MMEKYVIGEVDVTTVPTKRLYVAPGLGGTNPKDDKPGFLIKILQLLVPLLILGLGSCRPNLHQKRIEAMIYQYLSF
ncbi:hypothetical protein POPTR_011G055236v4 [Populus trichocarpa]|uniref:Uncharacterized protein n=1 Tax=Populus trichocarpa TaxID=3694 RepID=A0ACC0S7T3_POPTR|nr:hypothetical protein POPTR_011G055236v4 [Populus trichocarpa]